MTNKMFILFTYRAEIFSSHHRYVVRGYITAAVFASFRMRPSVPGTWYLVPVRVIRTYCIKRRNQKVLKFTLFYIERLKLSSSRHRRLLQTKIKMNSLTGRENEI